MDGQDGFDIWGQPETATFESIWACPAAVANKKQTAVIPGVVKPTEPTSMSTKKRARTVSLAGSSASLQAMAGQAAAQVPKRASTVFEAEGADPQDVRRRLENATCACKGPCHKAVKFKPLLQVCQLYWSLSALERGMLLRHEYAAGCGEADEEELPGPSLSDAQFGKAAWYLCGQQVCFPAFCSLLRTSARAVRRSIAGIPDTRYANLGGEKVPKGRRHEKSDHVDWFFRELYHSAAEPLPEDTRCIWADFAGPNGSDHQSDFQTPWEEPSGGNRVELLSSGVGHKPLSGGVGQMAEEQNYLPEICQNPVTTVTMTVCAVMVGLPVRYLQHVRLVDLYLQFVTAWDEQQLHGFLAFQRPPSFRLFAGRWRVWNQWLKIRAPSQHAQCQTCFELLRAMRAQGSSWGAKLQAARDLRTHYRLQYLGRCIYWSLRLMSQTYKDVLTIIIDGMDKSKFAFPRWPFDRVPKDVEKLIRPKVILTAAIAHGWCTSLFMTSEVLDHGSSLLCECLCQVLEEVWKISKQTGRRFPRHLVVVTDNTTGFAKNQHGLKFLAYLVATYKFVTANLLGLVVGHTHEDVDQLFAVVLWLMLRRRSWQTPAEILQAIADGLRERISRKGEVLIAVELTAVRDFKAWLGQLGLHTDHCFKTRDGIEAPHCFSMKLGSLLTAAERAMLVQVRSARPFDPGAVYCCVKMFMHSAQLQQEPCYQFPAGRAARVHPATPTGVLRRSLSEDQVKTYLRLAHVCAELDLVQAAQVLRGLVYRRRYFLSELTWLEHFRQPDVLELAEAVTVNPYFPHLPESSWRMVARLTA